MNGSPATNNELERRVNKLEIESGVVDSSIDALEKQMILRFEASEKLVTAAFNASEKAIEKSDRAQDVLDVKNNEFRAQIADQNKIQFPRTEAESQKNYQESKLDALRKDNEKAFDSIREDIKSLRESRSEMGGRAYDKVIEEIGRDIKSLRESRSEMGGRGLGANALWSWIVGIAGFIALLFALFQR